MPWMVTESFSWSNRPLVLALLTIWTRMGVSSPSKANMPCDKERSGAIRKSIAAQSVQAGQEVKAKLLNPLVT